MTAVFLKILNMSLTAGWMLLAIVLFRTLLKKAPKWVFCLLWGLAGLRLALPFTLKSAWSLIPRAEPVPAEIAAAAEPAVDTGIPAVNRAVNPILAGAAQTPAAGGANLLQTAIAVSAVLWLIGLAGMLTYALISYFRLKKTVAASILIRERVLACDEVQSPFILGVFRPKICVPSSLNGETLEQVLRHETVHLRRRDHWWKPLGFLLLSVHWFNPLCWLGYILFCRDIEAACDEKVIRDLEPESAAAYAQALLDCSIPRGRIAACPLAFGEAGVKARIKGILHYKKPAIWLIGIALLACVALAVCLMTDPFSGKKLSGKLAVSMDMAVAAQYRSEKKEGDFIAVDYDVLKIEKAQGRTTVYAWILYEEYGKAGLGVSVTTGTHVPAAVTFDTAGNGDASAYGVLEFRTPRDGGYYTDDINAIFPLSVRSNALDASGAEAQHQNCLRAARAYFGVPAEIRFEAKVMQTEKDTVTVAPDGEENAGSAFYTFSNTVLPKGAALQEGDVIELKCDGEILNVTPYRLLNVRFLQVLQRSLSITSIWTERVGWVDDPRVFTGCLNADRMSEQKTVHLPVFRIGSEAEAERFDAEFGDALGFKILQNYLYEEQSREYFARSEAIVVYVPESHKRYQPFIYRGSVSSENTFLAEVYNGSANTYESDDGKTGYIMILEVSKEDLRNCTGFDAQGYGDRW